MINSGNLFERHLSFELHKNKTPILISAKLLRQFGCAQVDIAYIEKGQIVLVEAKSSQIGIKSMKKVQWRRLMRSSKLIESMTGLPVVIKLIAKRCWAIYP